MNKVRQSQTINLAEGVLPEDASSPEVASSRIEKGSPVARELDIARVCLSRFLGLGSQGINLERRAASLHTDESVVSIASKVGAVWSWFGL